VTGGSLPVAMYETTAPKLSRGGIILGDNCHCNDVLANFSVERHRQFIFFREEPQDHWYPGGGIGISFVSRLWCKSGFRNEKDCV
jgi:hypothetical protein